MDPIVLNVMERYICGTRTVSSKGFIMPDLVSNVVRRFLASRVQLGPGVVDQHNTEALRRSPLKARGDVESAVLSAGFYAKKLNKTMYAYSGNAYGTTAFWRVSYKDSE